MLVPVVELHHSGVSRVYVDCVFKAVVFPLVHLEVWRCIDVETGEMYSASNRQQAVDKYFKSCYKECFVNE